MTHKQAIDFVNAIGKIADMLDMEPNKIGSLLYTFTDKGDKIKEAVRLYNEFYDADLPKRGELLGYEVTMCEDGNAEISTEI